jgi:hypothetical protein
MGRLLIYDLPSLVSAAQSQRCSYFSSPPLLPSSLCLYSRTPKLLLLPHRPASVVSRSHYFSPPRTPTPTTTSFSIFSIAILYQSISRSTSRKKLHSGTVQQNVYITIRAAAFTNAIRPSATSVVFQDFAPEFTAESLERLGRITHFFTPSPAAANSHPRRPASASASASRTRSAPRPRRRYFISFPETVLMCAIVPPH